MRLRLDPDGVPRVFEINPRFSGTSILTAAAGIDEIDMLLGQALGLPVGPRPVWTPGVAMIRHATETFVSDGELTSRRPTTSSLATAHEFR